MPLVHWTGIAQLSRLHSGPANLADLVVCEEERSAIHRVNVNGGQRGMIVKRGGFMRTVAHARNPHPLVLKLYLVVFPGHLEWILRDYRDANNNKQCKLKHSSRFSDIAMGLFDFFISGPVQPFLDIAGHHDGPMMASRATESDGQIALAFADIMRDQIQQQVRDPIHKFHGLGKGSDISSHARMPARELLERRNVIRVWQKTDIEHQVAVGRHPVAIPETGDVDADTGLFLLALKLRPNRLPQFVNIKRV